MPKLIWRLDSRNNEVRNIEKPHVNFLKGDIIKGRSGQFIQGLGNECNSI